jgi:hypothetical protein
VIEATWRKPRTETLQEAAFAEWCHRATREGKLDGYCQYDKTVHCLDGTSFLVSLKRQLRCTPERYGGAFPYAGHGDATLMVVEEPDTGLDFCQWLDVLLRGPSYTTPSNPRRVFALGSFCRRRFPFSADTDLTPDRGVL